MADEKITELTPITILEDTDLFAVAINVPSGDPVPETRAISHLNFLNESVTILEDDLVGIKTVFIPATAISPTVTNGCNTLVTVQTTATRPDISHLAFPNGGATNAQFSWSFPKSWDEGTITFQVYWTGLVGGAGGVSWKLRAVAVSDNDPIDVVFGTEIEATDTFIVIEDQHIAEESTAVTIAGTPAQGDMVYFNLKRDTADGDDTRAADANLLGIKILYTIDTLNDD